MLSRGTTPNEPELRGALKLLFDVTSDRLAEGYDVTTPVANLSVSLRGVFTGPDDSFDGSCHVIDVSATPLSQMRQELRRKVTVSKQIMVGKRPVLHQLIDCGSNEVNGSVTPGGMARITGAYLKFDAADTQEGIFLRDSSGTETRVAMTGVNKPGELVFLVPAGLTGGEYQVEVRTVLDKFGLQAGQLRQPAVVA
jgi:hypothetical protein